MKICISTDWGGFSLPPTLPDFKRIHSLPEVERRSDPALLEWLTKRSEYNEDATNGEYEGLTVVDIPDDITSFKVINIEDREIVVYCRNGKIYTNEEQEVSSPPA